MKNIVLIIFCLLFISCVPKEKLSMIYQEAVTLMQNEKFKETIDLLETAVPKLQRNFNYYYTLGYCNIRIDPDSNRRVANNFFMKAYRFDKKKYNNIYLLADTFDLLDDIKNAEVYFKKAVSIWDANPQKQSEFAQEPYGRLAKIFYKQGKYQDALSIINKSLEIEPCFQISVFLKGQIYAKLGNLSEFNDWYDKAMKINPDNVLLQAEYGHTLIEIGEFDKAEKFFLEMQKTAKKGETAQYLSYLGLLYLEILYGNNDKAYEYLQAASSMHADNNILRKYKIFYFWKTGQNMRANNAFRAYRYYAEDLSEVFSTTSTDLTEFFNYFKDDVYFKLLLSPD